MKNKSIVEMYLLSKKEKVQQSSIDKLRFILKQYLLYLENVDSLVIDKQCRHNYLESLSKHYSLRTFYAMVGEVKSFYSFCVLHGYVESNPFADVSIKSRYQPSNDILFDQELLDFLNCLATDKQLLFADRFILEMFIGTLGKFKDLLNLKMNRVAYLDGRLIFRMYGDHFYQANDFVAERWYDYVSYRCHRMFEYNQDHEILLVTDKGKPLSTYYVSNLFKMISDRYGYVLTPLKLRRSLIAYLVDQGVDVRDIQALTGLKNIHSASLYERFDLQKLKDTVNNCLMRERITGEDGDL